MPHLRVGQDPLQTYTDIRATNPLLACVHADVPVFLCFTRKEAREIEDVCKKSSQLPTSLPFG